MNFFYILYEIYTDLKLFLNSYDHNHNITNVLRNNLIVSKNFGRILYYLATDYVLFNIGNTNCYLNYAIYNHSIFFKS